MYEDVPAPDLPLSELVKGTKMPRHILGLFVEQRVDDVLNGRLVRNVLHAQRSGHDLIGADVTQCDVLVLDKFLVEGGGHVADVDPVARVVEVHFVVGPVLPLKIIIDHDLFFIIIPNINLISCNSDAGSQPGRNCGSISASRSSPSPASLAAAILDFRSS